EIGLGEQGINISRRVRAARQNGTIRLERQGGSALRLHLRRIEDRPASGVPVIGFIQQQLRKVHCYQFIFRVRVQRSFVKCLSLFKLSAGQRNLAGGDKSSCELGEQFCPHPC